MGKILIVDGDPKIGSEIAGSLNLSKHKFVFAREGLEALNEIYSSSFDLVFLDLNCPNIDGLSLLDVIRKRRPQCMVIIASDQKDFRLIAEALKRGAYSFLEKPFDLENLRETINQALKENQLMRNADYFYKDNRRNDKSLIRSGFIHALLDSIFIVATYYAAFHLAARILTIFKHPLFFSSGELLQMSLGIGFCYAFIFVFKKAHRIDLLDSKTELVRHLWRNISYTYILHLAILFITKDINFSGGRLALGLGYVFGFLGLVFNRFVLLPGLIFSSRREGRKNITIVGASQKTETDAVALHPMTSPREVSLSPNARVIATPEEADRLKLTERNEELYVAGDVFSAPKILNLADRFKGRKLKIIVFGEKQKACQKEAPVDHKQ